VPDVVLVVEDPGAANFVLSVPDELAARDIDAVLVATGPAAAYVPAHPRIVRDEQPSAAGLLEDLTPRLVVVGTAENPDTVTHALVDAARRSGIPTVGVVDGPANAAFRFRGRTGDPLRHVPDVLLVADVWTRDAYVELGCVSTAVIVTGHPHHDRVRASGAALDRTACRQRVLGADVDSPVVVFAAERSTGLDPAEHRRSADYTLQGRGASVGRTEIVAEEVLDALADVAPSARTVLRLHPKNEPGDLGDLAAEFDVVSATGSSIDVVVAADAVIGMSSILLEEALVLRVPTLSVVPRAIEASWSTAVRAGLIPVATERSAVRAALADLVATRPLPAIELVERAFPPGASSRVADVLAGLLGRAPAEPS
jgi:hypothetical protein